MNKANKTVVKKTSETRQSSKARKHSAEIADIGTRIMVAVWELTAEAPLKFVTRKEIAREIQRLYGGDLLTEEYIRRQINELQSGNGIFVENGLKYGPGKPETTYRLNEKTTIIFPETAWVFLSLCGKYRDHRISAKAVEEIKQEAEPYGINAEYVDDRISSAVKSGYIKDALRGEYVVCARLSSERGYLEKLAEKLVTSFSERLQTSTTSVDMAKPIENARV